MKDYDILLLHDRFGMELCKIHKFIDKINNYYNFRTGIDKYSTSFIIYGVP